MVVLVLTACLFFSCESTPDRPDINYVNSKWESIDNPNGVYYYFELRKVDGERTFIYKEYYFEDRFIPRPQYEITLTGTWWKNDISDRFGVSDFVVTSTNPSYHNPTQLDFATVIYYYRKTDRMVYMDRHFDRIVE